MAQPNPLTTPPPGNDTQIVPGHVEHTEAHTGAFPPFETSGYLAQLIWLALAFGLLYYLMDKVALPRIQSILHARAERLRADLDQAQAMKTEADAAGVAFETALRDAQGKARDIAQTTRNTLAAEAETKRKALEQELNGKLAAAETTIRARTESAMGNVRSIAGEAATAIVERLTGQAPDRSSLDRALDATAH